MGVKEGLVLTPRIADGLWRQDLSWIVLGEDIPMLYNQEMYVCDSTQVYGRVKISPPEKINVSELRKYRDMHGITEEDKAKWWPHKFIFHAYSLEWKEVYPEPLPAIIEGNGSIRTIEFKDITEQSLLEKDDDPSKMDKKSLIFNHALLHRFFQMKREGKLKGWSVEDIFNMHKLILEQMLKKKLKHVPRDRLDEISVPRMSQQAFRMDDRELLQAFWIVAGVVK